MQLTQTVSTEYRLRVQHQAAEYNWNRTNKWGIRLEKLPNNINNNRVVRVELFRTLQLVCLHLCVACYAEEDNMLLAVPFVEKC